MKKNLNQTQFNNTTYKIILGTERNIKISVYIASERERESTRFGNVSEKVLCESRKRQRQRERAREREGERESQIM